MGGRNGQRSSGPLPRPAPPLRRRIFHASLRVGSARAARRRAGRGSRFPSDWPSGPVPRATAPSRPAIGLASRSCSPPASSAPISTADARRVDQRGAHARGAGFAPHPCAAGRERGGGPRPAGPPSRPVLQARFRARMRPVPGRARRSLFALPLPCAAPAGPACALCAPSVDVSSHRSSRARAPRLLA